MKKTNKEEGDDFISCNGCGTPLEVDNIPFSNNDGDSYCSDCWQAIQSDPESAAGFIKHVTNFEIEPGDQLITDINNKIGGVIRNNRFISFIENSDHIGCIIDALSKIDRVILKGETEEKCALCLGTGTIYSSKINVTDGNTIGDSITDSSMQCPKCKSPSAQPVKAVEEEKEMSIAQMQVRIDHVKTQLKKQNLLLEEAKHNLEKAFANLRQTKESAPHPIEETSAIATTEGRSESVEEAASMFVKLNRDINPWMAFIAGANHIKQNHVPLEQHKEQARMYQSALKAQDDRVKDLLQDREDLRDAIKELNKKIRLEYAPVSEVAQLISEHQRDFKNKMSYLHLLKQIQSLNTTKSI